MTTLTAADRAEPAVPDRGDGSRDGSRELTVLDLFAGAGGLTEGFHQAGGFRTVAAVELDPVAAATYHANHPEARVYVGPIQEWLRTQDVPKVDVIIGGPPCQGFSTLGKQNAEDERNRLWEHYAATILRAEPKYFVVENVAAFSMADQFRLFTEATEPGGMLEDYRFVGRVLNAADYGAAQARRRTVIIGHQRDLEFPGWPAPTHVEHPVTVRQALARVRRHVEETVLPDRRRAFPGSDTLVYADPAEGRVARPGVFLSRDLHIGRTYTDLSMRRFRQIPPGGNRFDLPDELKAPCWIKHTSGSADVMGRLRWDEPSVTIRTEFFKPEKGRYLHPEEDRALTHYEAALLQGFPDDYRWVGSKLAIARQIGNAVPVALGWAVARALATALRSTAIGEPGNSVPVA